MGAATDTWPHAETDPQRLELLAAADRLLAGEPKHSTGNMSVVQLAVEAQVKYWIIAQKHTDLRGHFQRLASESDSIPAAFRDTVAANDRLAIQNRELRQRCADLEELLTLYATALNELALENQALRDDADNANRVVVPFGSRKHQLEQRTHSPRTYA